MIRRVIGVVVVMAVGLALVPGASPAVAQDEARVALSSLVLDVGEPGVVEAAVDCPAVCARFVAELQFDPAVLRVDGVFAGPYLGAGALVTESVVDNVAGRARLAVEASGPSEPLVGGALFLLSVSGLGDGVSPLTFAQFDLFDSAGGALPVMTASAEVTVGAASVVATANPTAEIAFVSERDGNTDLYLMNADGSGVARLTMDPSRDEYPVWSPDGTRLAFVSDRAGSLDIFVIAPDGTGLTQLTSDPAADELPAWSPDGSQIVFVSDREGEISAAGVPTTDLYLMNADGSGVTRLTTDSANESMPAWSPDGTRIVYVSDRDGGREIYVMNADGTGQTRLTQSFGANSWFPAWSPDGTRLSFTYERAGQGVVYTMLADGTSIQPVNTPAGWVGRTAWSPDGAQLALAAAQGGSPDVFTVQLADGTLTALTNLPSANFDPHWRPVSAAPSEAVVLAATGVVCTVSTGRADAAIRVGPGAERAVFTFMTPGTVYTVTGQGAAKDGSAWWQLDKAEVTDTPSVNSLWVAQAEVTSSGDCAQVGQADAPPVIYAPPPAATGSWGTCGSCNTCGYAANECLTNPQGQCVWDPTTCRPGGAPAGTPAPGGGGDCATLSLTVYSGERGTVQTSGTSCGSGSNSFKKGTMVQIQVFLHNNVNSYVGYWEGTCPGLMSPGVYAQVQQVQMNQNCSVTIHLSGND